MDPHDETGRDTTGETATETVASVSKAARLLGISEGAVRKWIERGQLRAAKFKNQWQITIGTDDLAETALRDATRRDETGQHTPQEKLHRRLLPNWRRSATSGFSLSLTASGRLSEKLADSRQSGMPPSQRSSV